jgi:hypothetical protein
MENKNLLSIVKTTICSIENNFDKKIDRLFLKDKLIIPIADTDHLRCRDFNFDKINLTNHKNNFKIYNNELHTVQPIKFEPSAVEAEVKYSSKTKSEICDMV